MTRPLTLLAVHAALLLIAMTSFTILTVFDDGQLSWQFFELSYHYSSRAAYGFPYGLAVVLVYLAANATGLAAYYQSYRDDSPGVGLAGMLLCGVGLASFAFELTHWIVNHNYSCIVSLPIVVLVLAIVAAIQEYRRPAVRLGDPQM